MPFDRISTPTGVPLPFRTWEGYPRGAQRLGNATVEYWLQRLSLTRAGQHMRKLQRNTERFVELISAGDEVSEEIISDFSVFCRCAASLRELRKPRTNFDSLARKLLTARWDDQGRKDFAHDEFHAFIAAKLRGYSIPVEIPPVWTGDGAKNPDLFYPCAQKTNDDLYMECKERAPEAPRSERKLLRYAAKRAREAARQISKRDSSALAIACVDFGLMRNLDQPAMPTLIDRLRPVFDGEPNLAAVLISASFHEIDTANYVIPTFRSYFIDKSTMAGPLRHAVSHRFFNAFHPSGQRPPTRKARSTQGPASPP